MDRPTVVLRPSRRANVVDMSAPDLLGGRYELRGVLGRGGMAEVRDGWDTRLHRAVAIKLLHPGLIAQADIRMRFAAEARSAAALSHPNVVAVLAAAHAAGILHRDIKPANILLTDLGHTKVANFGIAKCAETTHTMTGQIVGTMAYLTPERIAGRRATVSDDLYARSASSGTRR